jgi:hypothetical protein
MKEEETLFQELLKSVPVKNEDRFTIVKNFHWLGRKYD